MQKTESPILEIARFRLADGVTEAQFIEASDGMNEFLRAQAGFIRRRMVQEETLFTDMVEWESKSHAEAAFQAFFTHPKTVPVIGMIAQDSLQMAHLPILTPQD